MQFARPLALVAALAVSGQASAPLSIGSPDAELTRLFTPRAAPVGMYKVYRSRESIEALTSRLKAEDPTPMPGAWEPTRPEGASAFGIEGLYDSSRLARLFNGKRVTLVRGSLKRDSGRVAYTLISPYPDPTLSQIVSGTMVVEFRVPSTPNP